MELFVESFGEKGKRVIFKGEGFNEQIRFSPYTLTSERGEFDITQEYGLNKEGLISKNFIPFEENSVEALLIDVIRDGNVERLVERDLIYNERPSKGEISRNLAVYDPETNFCYTIGGLGLIKPVKNDHTRFVLNDPELNQIYSKYQGKRGKSVGGTCYFSDEGLKFSTNMSKLGTMEYNSGPYHIVRKIEESAKLASKGINTPEFIAAGPINSLDDGRFGFSIYRSQLTPEYMLNLSLYLGEQGQFKGNFREFIASKYQQLSKLHHEIGDTHGQPTNTNSLVEIKKSKDKVELVCQIKDFETNHPVPTNTSKTITEGICPIKIGMTVKKSPHVAAMIYDLQLAISQECNVLFLPLQSINDNDVKLQYINQQALKLIEMIVVAYNVNPENVNGIQNFTLNALINAMKKGVDISLYNQILGGLIAHAIFGFSKQYANQIEVHK